MDESRPTRVLVVDDERDVRTLVCHILVDQGYEVDSAVDGREALEKIRAGAPDLVVLDLMMPEVDGVAVLRVRRNEDLAPDTRILILTAKTDTQDAVWCWELGADEYVTKPVDPDRLLRTGLALLERTPDELRHHREVGLAEARRMDELEAAFSPEESKHRRP